SADLTRKRLHMACGRPVPLGFHFRTYICSVSSALFADVSRLTECTAANEVAGERRFKMVTTMTHITTRGIVSGKLRPLAVAFAVALSIMATVAHAQGKPEYQGNMDWAWNDWAAGGSVDCPVLY